MKHADNNPAPSAESLGRAASAQWETPQCPFAAGTPEASAWADALLAGRHAFSWNTRNLIGMGSTCRYISEAIDIGLSIAVAKAIFRIGAEAPVMFRIGFILNSHDCQLPVLDVQGWREIAMVVNRGLQGRELADVGLKQDPTWLQKLAFICARSFMLDIIGHPLPAIIEEGKSEFTVELGKVIPWMGAKSDEHADLIPRPAGA